MTLRSGGGVEHRAEARRRIVNALEFRLIGHEGIAGGFGRPLLTVPGAGVCVKGGVVNPLGASVGGVCATTATAMAKAAEQTNKVDFCIMPVQTRRPTGVFPKDS
jgi:nicotinamide mononucleotide (NMN) deamidase PncC